jgi:AcrR family transcriptional regulator
LPKVVAEYKRQARQRIVETAVRVFSEKGYHRTTMEDIAEELGVSKGAIYLYFRSKEGLVREICKIAPARLREDLTSSFGGRDMLTGASAFFEESLARSMEGLGLYFEIIGEAHRSVSIRKMLLESYTRSLEILTEFIERLGREGRIRRDFDATSLALGLVATHDGLMASIVLGKDASEAKKAWNETISIIIRGMQQQKNQKT